MLTVTYTFTPRAWAVPNRFRDLLLGKIVREFPCAKPFPAQVNRIGPGRHGGQERLRGTAGASSSGIFFFGRAIVLFVMVASEQGEEIVDEPERGKRNCRGRYGSTRPS